jgi:hypothetical protein
LGSFGWGLGDGKAVGLGFGDFGAEVGLVVGFRDSVVFDAGVDGRDSIILVDSAGLGAITFGGSLTVDA